MLDLDNPMTDHIFTASAMIGSLMKSVQRMTLLPSKERVLLLAECLPIIDKMRRLNDDHFEASQFISKAIGEAQEALEQLAHLKGGTIVEDKSDGEGNCAACGTLITKFESSPGRTWSSTIIVCGHCDEPFMNAKEKLESPEGFATVFI